VVSKQKGETEKGLGGDEKRPQDGAEAALSLCFSATAVKLNTR